MLDDGLFCMELFSILVSSIIAFIIASPPEPMPAAS
jgi:hypothetical protein